ncbi:unnamed protein product [Clonostachys rosea f. rosea IK726]|uniref:Uncharacterized protein n=1 Tax=Clonostachys rosea f. rosea IK726 TaxID=1349383 RepID=A0ACA9TAK8_BIOOC|nr:unnamed protein product [Clonostachys rosea f. rosea IK726]
MPAVEGLEPPGDSRKANPGALTLADQSDSEDQFVDAQSSPHPISPIPKPQVEQDNKETAPSEIPGTDADKLKDNDDIDEKAVLHETSPDSTPQAIGETPKPATEEVPEPIGSHSEDVDEKLPAAANPDVKVTGTDGVVEEISINDSTVSTPQAELLPEPQTTQDSDSKEVQETGINVNGEHSQDDDMSEGFDQSEGFEEAGDDFDDFEEGGQEDDDFDDFDDGFQQAEPVPTPTQATLPVLPVLPFPIPDFEDLDSDEIISSLDQYLMTLFPPEELDLPPLPQLPREASTFITSRSASLWSQLVAPPPLAPPDWIRSRTRRLFLVSLGVPVDLDEILPASKQKKLVLPSLNIPSSSSPRTSHEARSATRLRQDDANASSTSVDTQGKPRHRRGPSPQPELDIVAARHLCTTTDEALNGMTDEELSGHIEKLKVLEVTAKEVLEYWTKRTDEKIAERETFEGVIENLVKHARKVRK